jgi:hypothetical protein
MLVIVARPDFRAIRDLFVEGSEAVKKFAYAGHKIACCLTAWRGIYAVPLTSVWPRAERSTPLAKAAGREHDGKSRCDLSIALRRYRNSSLVQYYRRAGIEHGRYISDLEAVVEVISSLDEFEIGHNRSGFALQPTIRNPRSSPGAPALKASLAVTTQAAHMAELTTTAGPVKAPA